MALFDFFKPKWKSKNPEVRLAAVRALGAADVATLGALAAGDEDARVRLAAVERIADRQALEDLARGSLPPDVAEAVRGKVDLLLFEAVLGAPDSSGAEAALERIGDAALLERLAAEASSPALRVGAVERIADPQALCRVLERNCGKEPARAALAKVDDEDLLARLARSGASKVTRRLAEEKLSARAAEREEPVRRAQRDRELAGLVAEAEELASAPDLAAASARLASLRLAWEQFDAGLRDPRRPAFDAAAQRFEERRKDERRRLEEERLSREEARRHEEERHRQEQEARRARVAAPAPVPEEAAERLAEGEAVGEGQRAEAVEGAAGRAEGETLAQREALCVELEGLADAADRGAAGRRAREIRSAWRKLPSSPGERAVVERFRAAEERFAARQESFAQEQQWLRWNNKTLKEGLCAEAEALEAEEDLSALAGRVKELQRRWREVGAVPKADSEDLWARFKAACDRSFERARPHLEELERRRAEAADRKEVLCREAEAHAESTAWKESAEALKRAQAEWRQAGPLLRKREEELYGRFRRACDRFFERRQAHLAGLDEERRGSQAEKEKLCERAEALAAEPDRRRIKEVRDLQAEWKKAGPAPRDAERALWERFRGACDRFFDGLDGDRGENLRQKEALCRDLEALLAAAGAEEGRGEAPAAPGEFRRRWDEIGPVPFEDAEALWDRFQALCDAYVAARHGEGSGRAEATPDAQAES